MMHNVLKRKQHAEDWLSNAWQEVSSPLKFDEHIEDEFDFNPTPYLDYIKDKDTLQHVSKKPKMVNRDGVHQMNVDSGPSTHAGPETSIRMRRSRYHNTLGVKWRKKSKRAVEEATENSGNTFDKTLIISNLINVPYSANEYDDHRRNGYQAFVKGVKLQCCFKIRQGQSVLTDPLTIRWAILVPETNTGATSDIATTDFFMQRETTTDEFSDFPSTGNYLEYHARRINTSKYGIMKSGTFTLGPSSSGSDAYRHWDQTKLMNIFVPLNRVFQWDNITSGAGDEEPTSNLHLVWWYTERGDLNTAKQFSGAGTGPIAFNVLKTTYFKNVHL